MLGVPIYNSKHKVIGALGGSYDVTALSRMLFEDLFNGQEDITLHICQWGVNGWTLCYALPEQAAQQSYNFIEDYEIRFMIVFIVLVTLLILYIVYENHTRNKELLKYAQTDELKGNNISISIGISTAPQDGDCYMDLYKRADQALYQAKRSGKARVCNYFS